MWMLAHLYTLACTHHMYMPVHTQVSSARHRGTFAHLDIGHTHTSQGWWHPDRCVHICTHRCELTHCRRVYREIMGQVLCQLTPITDHSHRVESSWGLARHLPNHD